jgi:hypothetical protein
MRSKWYESSCMENYRLLITEVKFFLPEATIRHVSNWLDFNLAFNERIVSDQVESCVLWYRGVHHRHHRYVQRKFRFRCNILAVKLRDGLYLMPTSMLCGS